MQKESYFADAVPDEPQEEYSKELKEKVQSFADFAMAANEAEKDETKKRPKS
jgi:hypothetical protein